MYNEETLITSFSRNIGKNVNGSSFRFQEKIKMRTEKQIQLEILNIIGKTLNKIKDDSERFATYIHWVTRAKYLIELKICYEYQGFKTKYSWDKCFDLSLQLAKEEWEETNKEINDYRNSKNYLKI
jgi:hypothetical protein